MGFRSILIGGVPFAGKTILARRLVAQHGYSRLPGDPLVLAFQQVFPAVGIAHTKDGFRESCAAFGRYAAALMNALPWESNMRYVLDSFYFRPHDLSDVDPTKTRVLFLGYPEADVDDRIRAIRQHQQSWPAEAQRPDVVLRETIPQFIEMSRQDREACAKRGLDYFDIGRGFDAVLGHAMRAISNSASMSRGE